MSHFTIDFFELMFLAENCTPPRPIARATFWQHLCDNHYHTMSEGERQRAFEWLSPKLNTNNEDARLFLARFDPDNQYLVTAKAPDSETQTHKTFLFDGKYCVKKDKYVWHEYIEKIEKCTHSATT